MCSYVVCKYDTILHKGPERAGIVVSQGEPEALLREYQGITVGYWYVGDLPKTSRQVY